MKSIIFSEEETMAALEGRKTLFHRVIIPQPENTACLCSPLYYSPLEKRNYVNFSDDNEENCATRYPKYQLGEVLYVKEPFCSVECYCCDNDPNYCDERFSSRNADGVLPNCCFFYKASDDLPDGSKWEPPSKMPLEAARIFIRITGIRVERVQGVTEEDAQREGVLPELPHFLYRYTRRFAKLWEKTNKRMGYPWGSNPVTFAYSFEIVSKEGARDEDTAKVD
jgi:hypothetical protein